MTISEKAYQIALKLRDPDRSFALADAISDVLWKSFAHKWDTRYADVDEAFNALENVVLKGWNVKPRIIADIMGSLRAAITDGYEWHTPLSETVDRRPEATHRSLEGKLKYAIRFSDGSYWYGYGCMEDDITLAKRYATVAGAKKQAEECMKRMPEAFGIKSYDIVEVSLSVIGTAK